MSVWRGARKKSLRQEFVSGCAADLAGPTLLDDKVCYRLLLAVRTIRSLGGGMNGIVPVKRGQLRSASAGFPEILVRAGANAVFAAEELSDASAAP